MAATFPPTKRFHFVDDVSDQDAALLECIGVVVHSNHVQLPPNAVIVSELLDCPTNGDTTTIYCLEGLDIRIVDRPAYSDLCINCLPFLLKETLSEDDQLSDISFLELREQLQADTRWLQEQQRAAGVAEEEIIDDYEPDDSDPLQWSEKF